jgi:voltage-gated sodium channel
MFGKNDPWHFGKLHVAMLSLFRIATYEDWTDIMYINIFGCDMWNYNSDDSLPSRDMCVAPGGKGALAAFYFVLFAMISAMVLLTLFVGVVSTSMDEAGEKAKHKVRQPSCTRGLCYEDSFLGTRA